MDILSKLFKFPIIMIDGDVEERKMNRASELALNNEEDVEMIEGEAECPYFDFISITDRWLPTEDSYEKALKGQFDACNVIFGQSGSFMVPWSKAVFKKALAKFIEKLPKEDEIAISLISKEDLRRK